MPQHVWDTKAISNAASQRGPAGNFPALSITPTRQDPRSRRLLRPPIPGPGPARGAGVAAAASIPFLSAGVGGPGRVVRIGSGARALPGAGARQRGPRQRRQNRGPSERGRQEGQLRAALRVSKAGNAASPAADEDKAPDSQPPPPPASRPATQRHAHGPRRLRISLVARQPPGSAHRSRQPRPFPRACLRGESRPLALRRGAASWAPAGGDAGGRSWLFVSALAIRCPAGMGPRQRPASAKRHPAR